MGDFTLVLDPFVELLQFSMFPQSVTAFFPCLYRTRAMPNEVIQQEIAVYGDCIVVSF